VLIKAVLESQPVYWMALAHIPISVLQRIQKMMISFLWLRNKNKHNYHLSNWETISKPKIYGGWGLRNIFVFYRALETNTLWRALMKIDIWKRVIKDKYFPHGSVLTWLRSVALVTSYGSQTWKNLLNTFTSDLTVVGLEPGLGTLYFNWEGCNFGYGARLHFISGVGAQS
jgi:hypothetical protein